MSTASSAFSIALMEELMASMTNWYGAENWDYERFGAYKSSFKSLLITKLNQLAWGKVAIVPRDVSCQMQNLSAIQGSIEGLSEVFDSLGDEHSRSTLVKVVAYRVMGHKRVKLPLNTNGYWTNREFARSLIKGSDSIKISFHNWELNRFDLSGIGFPIELFFSPGGVFANFILKQYEYQKTTPAIKAGAGDYVIDCGGCWGDTALYFAHVIGESGKVYAFEFLPENLEVFERNMALNSELSKRISVIPEAVWAESGAEIAYSDNGPGTSLKSTEGSSTRVSTVAIDDFVARENLPRVDLIKMDVEGAELQALQGAETTLRTFRPRLAISVYHKENDLVDIPNYLERLNVGYDFFLDHFTIHGEETVLFAAPRGWLTT